MAYGTDIDNLGADHRWAFDGDSTDAIGSVDGTDSSVIYTSVAICKDTTNCMETDAIDDRVSIPTTTEINNSAQARKTVCGWYAATAIQNPPKNIYGEGDATQAFRFILGWGNYLMFEVDDPNFTIQVFGDTPLAINRPYHMCMIFEGSGYANEVRAYLDGVKQLNAEPSNRQPGATTLTARSVGEFGDPAGTVAVGGTAVILIAPINGKWNQWATWGDEVDAVLSDTDVRVELFEKGALADVTISAGTEAEMQTALNTYSGTTRSDAPCCIEIEEVTVETGFTLNLNNITFDELASIHIKYLGTTKPLTLVNKGGSDCSIVSNPFGGNLTVKTDVTLLVTAKNLSDNTLVSGATVYIKADTGGDLTAGEEILLETTNVSGYTSTVFEYTSDQPIIGYIRQGTVEPFLKQGNIGGPITSNGLAETILLIPDE